LLSVASLFCLAVAAKLWLLDLALPFPSVNKKQWAPQDQSERDDFLRVRHRHDINLFKPAWDNINAATTPMFALVSPAAAAAMRVDCLTLRPPLKQQQSHPIASQNKVNMSVCVYWRDRYEKSQRTNGPEPLTEQQK
jgi:hypothetical protein